MDLFLYYFFFFFYKFPQGIIINKQLHFINIMRLDIDFILRDRNTRILQFRIESI